MRLLSRSDATLVVGLVASAAILFQQPLRSLLDFVHEIELRYHVDLLPALIVLVGAFLLHQQSKRHHTAIRAAQVEVETEHIDDLARLTALSHALVVAKGWRELERVLRQHLPRFVGSRDCWILLCRDGVWEPLLEPPAADSEQQLQALARQALAFTEGGETRAPGKYHSLPLRNGDAIVGLCIVRQAPPVTTSEAQLLTAAAALIEGAVATLQLVLDLRGASMRDELTGCIAREEGLAILERELHRSQRTRSALAIIMCDVDNFKAVNDRYGHLAGDQVLAAVGDCLLRVMRQSDYRCRYGGDEFLLILPDTPLRNAAHVADYVRQEIGELCVPFGSEEIAITASFGVAHVALDNPHASSAIAEADQALYQAKHAGKNSACVANAPATLTVRRRGPVTQGPQQVGAAASSTAV